MQVDLNQGTTEEDNVFGYVAGNDGGFFFTWLSSIEDTVDSVEEDGIDGPGGLESGDVKMFLSNYLPTTPRGQETFGGLREVGVISDGDRWLMTTIDDGLLEVWLSNEEGSCIGVPVGMDEVVILQRLLAGCRIVGASVEEDSRGFVLRYSDGDNDRYSTAAQVAEAIAEMAD